MKTFKLTESECNDVREAILDRIGELAKAREAAAHFRIQTNQFDDEIAAYRCLLNKFSA